MGTLNVFVLQVYKSNDYNVNVLNCNCQLPINDFKIAN